jgi:hypothetical protein
MFTTVHVLRCTLNDVTPVSAADASAGKVSSPAVLWPPCLLQPQRPPALVYLDLNHYINLARTIAGEPVPNGYEALLLAARRACSEGRAVFPLSATHYVEMSGIRDPGRRTAVAAVMEELSDFHVLLGRVTIARLEIDGMIDIILSSETHGQPLPLLGTSMGWAFGVRGGLTIRDADGNDVTASAVSQIGESKFAEAG